MKFIDVYTDGACSGNPGPGGAAAYIRNIIKGKDIEVAKYCDDTTNQRMEIMAIYIALSNILKVYTVHLEDLDDVEITIFSDSAYAVRAFNEGWLDKWVENGWITSTKKSVANQDLWGLLYGAVNSFKNCGAKIHFIKVKGHSDNKLNNKVDALAVQCRTEKRDIFREVYTGV